MTNYGMFTDIGNMAIDEIVNIAKTTGADWKTVLAMLNNLSELEDFKEASDTAVREAVYGACNFTSDFYI